MGSRRDPRLCDIEGGCPQPAHVKTNNQVHSLQAEGEREEKNKEEEEKAKKVRGYRMSAGVSGFELGQGARVKG